MSCNLLPPSVLSVPSLLNVFLAVGKVWVTLTADPTVERAKTTHKARRFLIIKWERELGLYSHKGREGKTTVMELKAGKFLRKNSFQARLAKALQTNILS